MFSCDLLTISDEALEYPTKYPQLEIGELESLNAEYQSVNNGRLCSTLNEYGFTGFSEILFENGENPCERTNRGDDVVRVEMDNPDTLASAAKKILLKNSKYTGVQDTNKLVLNELLPQPGCINCGRPDEYSANIEWKLTFKNQVIDSAEVLGTEITVFVDAEGVNRIWGNWYPDFKIPDFVNFGYLDVMQGMVGWKIHMSDYTGEDSTYTVQEEDITEIPEKVHLPIVDENSNDLEIRTCWAVPILKSKDENFSGWIAYIDIEEGFLVDLVSMQEIALKENSQIDHKIVTF
ncbi:MAG: hypothetical protein HUJ22_02050 [Gracilimonas sp.]|uniref:hypothetical protein n=1 Tax=Gracilimonas sp. TaxID=1974203 RepID=UPI0019861A10|nr:hypothetical protein [Gracilimonas sp.]MBD3615327.1 hypothetical protein [Gracilimonas sp.]